MARPLASNNIPARIGDVRIDTVLSVTTSRTFDRTQVSTEQGAPSTAHRQRLRYQLNVEILVSDNEPIFAALVTGTWELDHASKTRARIDRLQVLGTTVQFFDGRRLWTIPGGRSAWIIDDVTEREGPEETGAWRATILLGEDSKFQTIFTSIDAGLDASIQDASDGVVDKGQQSTSTVPADVAATIPT